MCFLIIPMPNKSKHGGKWFVIEADNPLLLEAKGK